MCVFLYSEVKLRPLMDRQNVVGTHCEHYGAVKNNEPVLYLKTRMGTRNTEDTSRKQCYVTVSCTLKYIHIIQYIFCKNTM